jgi:16S rRNA (cytidine1402-2'-O)-methyltransferase
MNARSRLEYDVMVQYLNGEEHLPGLAMGASTLFLVATPIGNLEDITLRALRVLREVSLIAAEDTRRTAKLLSHFDIHTRTTSFYEQVEREKTPRLLGHLASGQSLALVSDAGTPGISDPGYRLALAAIEAGFRVEAVPGPSAVLAALVPSGLPTSTFSFVGFPPPRSQARERWLAGLASRTETLVFFEAPHRIRETLEAILSVLGDRPIAVGRELTKVHEEVVRGSVSAVVARLPVPRGEFTVVLGGATAGTITPERRPGLESLHEMFCQMTESGGLSRREAVRTLAAQYGLSSRELYAALEKAKTLNE